MSVAAERFRQVYPDSIGKEESATAAEVHSLLYGITARDPVTLLAAAGTILVRLDAGGGASRLARHALAELTNERPGRFHPGRAYSVNRGV